MNVKEPNAYFPGALTWEQDGDRHPLDTYICQSAEPDRLCTMNGHNSVSMLLAAQRIVAVMNAARNIESPKLIEAAPAMFEALRLVLNDTTAQFSTVNKGIPLRTIILNAIIAAQQPYEIPCQSTPS